MEAISARTDVVLGDDWVGPGDAVETEVRDSRARRGLFSISASPLARKIVLFNLVALVILIAGILFTNPFRDSLLRQQEEMLGTSVQLIADIVSANGDLEATRDVIASEMSLDQRFEMYFIGPDGAFMGHLRGTAEPDLADLPDRSTVISDTLSAIWSGLSFLTDRGSDAGSEDEFTRIAQEMFDQNLRGDRARHTHREMRDGMWLAASAPVVHDGEFAGAVFLRRDAEDTARLMRHDHEQVLQFFLIAVLVSIGLSFVLASNIANPLADLAMAAELGKRRDARKSAPGARVRIPDLSGRPDEIGDLSRAMRGIVNALYDRVEANEQFAADVAHEIKNPLASLRSAVGTLRMAKREDQVNRLLDVIEQDVRRLDRLVSDTSNASRLDAELVKEEQEEFDLVKLLNNLCEHLSTEARDKGVEFINALPKEPVMLTGLEGRLAQVFVNLITNAISLCEDGDAVRVWARQRQDRVLIVVEDTGPGIPDNALKKVFKRFYSQRPVQQFGNHSGLGLAISKQIVEAHQGVIWAENIRPAGAAPDSPPMGARFVVGLPL
ncbi:MAG: sensor histidine kinase [Rhodobacteraceae bacterium]|nr:sensor histidine kinase [Paracoccaceae bacterium]TVR43853.1 MAG: histidine kinase [Paracoccaceae bacterium]